MNYYGFKKLDKLENVEETTENGFVPWAIVHPFFLRDSPELIYQIKRKTRREKVDFGTTLMSVTCLVLPCSVASKSEVTEVRKELKFLTGSLAKDLTALREQLQEL